MIALNLVVGVACAALAVASCVQREPKLALVNGAAAAFNIYLAFTSL